MTISPSVFFKKNTGMDALIAQMARMNRDKKEASQSNDVSNGDKDEDFGKGEDLGLVFAAWYCVQKGLGDARERLGRWKVLREQVIMMDKSYPLKVDYDGKEIRVEWGNAAPELKNDVVFHIGAMIDVRESYSPPSKDDGSCNAVECYRTVQRLFFKTDGKPLTNNNRFGRGEAEDFAPKTEPTIIPVSANLIDIRIDARCKKTDDLITTFVYTLPKPPTTFSAKPI